MNEPTVRLESRPEVIAFVERVRDRLADLSDEEREELVGGLVADIHELVEDGGSVAELGDPRAYADELRLAAGLERRAAGAPDGEGGFRRPRPRLRERVDRALDASRRRWRELVDAPALRAAWELVTTMRPVWWVLRAWVAMQLLDLVVQGGDVATPVPKVGGPLLGALLWLAAVVVSVQIGRDRIWPGSGPARTTLARVVLLGLNAFAVLMTPVVLGQFPASGTWADQSHGYSEPDPGLMNQGQYVRNVYPFDAQGDPLTGVQLFDENGNPLTVATWFSGDLDGDGRASIVYPWLNGEKRLFNVFPLPEREQPAWRTETSPDAWTSATPPSLPTPPLAAVPPVRLPEQELAADDAPGGSTGAAGDAPGGSTGAAGGSGEELSGEESPRRPGRRD